MTVRQRLSDRDLARHEREKEDRGSRVFRRARGEIGFLLDFLEMGIWIFCVDFQFFLGDLMKKRTWRRTQIKSTRTALERSGPLGLWVCGIKGSEKSLGEGKKGEKRSLAQAQG